jgi:lambda family phage tail tape measure protein
MAQDTKIRITAETAEAQRALKELGGSLTGLKGNLVSFSGAIGGALSVSAFANFIKSSIDLQDELDALSKKTGVSASDLGGLKFAADQNGASLDLVAKGVKELSLGLTNTPEKFAKLGINAKNATGALVQVADLVAGMPDGMQKTALLAELMGKKVGPEMAEFLSQGGAALQQYIAKGKDIYKVTDDSAAKAAEYKDQMAELSARIAGAGIAISTHLLPGLNETAKAMNDLANEGHPVLALWRGFAGMGKVAWDLLIPPENLKESLSSAGRIKELKAEIKDIEDGFFSLSKADNERIAMLKQQISVIERHSAELDKASSPKDKPKTSGKSVADLLNGDKAKGDGLQIVIGLEREYQAELAKRKDAMAAPLLSAAEKQLAEDMRKVTKQAQDARIELEKLHASKNGISDADYSRRLDEITAKEQAQVAAVKELQAQQDKLNASWEYGAAVAMRKYLDDVGNTAKQTEKLVTGTFSAMESAIAKFYRSGSLDIESFKNAVLDMMAQIAAQKTMTGLMGLFGSGGGYGDTAGVAAGVPKFDGGGFTGVGARSGGVDGKGGFVAVLHPNETVLDHTKGQGAGGIAISYAPVIQIDSRTDKAEVERLVSNAVQQGNAQLVDKLQRQRAI